MIFFDITNFQVVRILDMFGLMTHFVPTYEIVVHIVAITFGIQAIQVYKVARRHALRYMPVIL